MKIKNLLTTMVLTVMFLIAGKVGWGQPWTYDFGTGTGSYAVASGSSTTFFTGTPATGGTYRVRCASSGNFGTGFVLANPGTSLGSETELQINAAKTTSTSKFTVYGYDSPSSVSYLKANIRTTGTGADQFYIALGNSAIGGFSDNSSWSTNASLPILQITYASGSISAVNRRNAGSWTAISSHGLLKDSDQKIEFFCNNSSVIKSYTKGGTTYNLASQSWDLFVDDIKI